MVKRAGYIALTLVLTACIGEPGGGGVNIDSSTTVPTTVVTTTTTTTPATTTTLPPVVVRGTVTRASGDPVAGASVTMGDVETISGPDGTFVIETYDPAGMTITKRGWSATEIVWNPEATTHDATIDLERVRGLRVSADAAADDGHFGSLLELAASTAVNALVFDTKQEGGQVLYESTVAEANEMGAVNAIYDPGPRLQQAHDAGLYTITRIVTFEDAYRVATFPEEKLAGPWVDPGAVAAQAYNIALAAEACEKGFDEIQFDYVRYPSGQTAQVSGQMDLTQETRVAAISGFLADAKSVLEPMGCSVSAAVFGIVASMTDDQGLGQRIEEVSANSDAISPMVYPSHYSPGWLGYQDPNAYPYEVTADALSDAAARLAPGAHLRPWLQAFWWTDDQIRRSIQAAEDLGTGWILWNVASNFNSAALPTDAEVSG